MMLLEYFDQVKDGIEFLTALGSLLGLFGILYAIAWWGFTSKKNHQKLFTLIVASALLIGICGLYTGIKYFRI
jgi:hypothetical protein